MNVRAKKSQIITRIICAVCAAALFALNGLPSALIVVVLYIFAELADHVVMSAVSVNVEIEAGRSEKRHINISLSSLIYAVFILLTITLFLMSAALSYRSYIRERNFEQMRERIADEKYIIHAGGYMYLSSGKRRSYTNSLEALENCYASGNRVSEFDFRLTDDDRLVLGHDTETEWAVGIGVDADAHITEEEFLKQRIYDELTPMSLTMLADFMKEHEDFLVITDVKDDNIGACRQIAERYPELRERFIIQIYNEYEFEPVNELGFPYILLTLYRIGEKSPEYLGELLDRYRLLGFVFSENKAANSRFLEGVVKLDALTCVHTVNDDDKIAEYLMSGITAVYTDRTDLREN